MRITVLYFGPVRELLGGRAEETLELDANGATIALLERAIVERHPELGDKMGFIRFARNEAMVEVGEPLVEGDVVALIPPVAGGSEGQPPAKSAGSSGLSDASRLSDASGSSRRVVVATLTISDSRTAADDRGGPELRRVLAAAGFDLAAHGIVPDGIESVRAAIRERCADPTVDAIVTTGGTGLAPRDQTYEAIEPLLGKKLDGFGEAFRRLSWDQIGAKGILSRALAGTIGDKVVVALPGSPRSLALAVEEILAPVLGHIVGLVRGGDGHARGGEGHASGGGHAGGEGHAQ